MFSRHISLVLTHSNFYSFWGNHYDGAIQKYRWITVDLWPSLIAHQMIIQMTILLTESAMRAAENIMYGEFEYVTNIRRNLRNTKIIKGGESQKGKALAKQMHHLHKEKWQIMKQKQK